MTTLLPSTESTILANWPVLSDLPAPHSRTYHFAVRQNGVSLDFHIRQYYRNKPASFHYFDTFEQLLRVCQRYPVCAIVIGGHGDFLREIDLVRGIKQNVFLSIIPIILYHPEPPMSMVVAAYENGAEEFIYGEWVDRLVDVRLRRVIERNRRDMAVNPSTMLPGTAIIEQELSHQMSLGNSFAACYADLDNFKAFNDYYGYFRGDKVVKLTARILKDVVFDLCPEGFVGHIAGDDFMFIIPADLVETVCGWVIKCFDTIIPFRYEEEDRERGFITTVNRRGVVESFPILSISIAVIVNDNGKFSHVGELARMLADLKKITKQKPGSNFMIERRAKY